MKAIYPPSEEPALVRQFFGGAPGTFVDVGANDPVVNSQTHHLELAGWNGILVEPIPELARRLEAERKALVFEGACGAQEGRLQLNVAGVYSSLLAVTEGAFERSVSVKVRRLDAVLDDAGIKRVDFVSIDVEGYEIEVLRGFSLERWRPRLILIEDRIDDLSRHRYLSARGYKLVRRTGINAWYVPRDYSFRLSWRARWQLVRKYVLGLPVRKLRNTLRAMRTPRA